MKATVRSLKLLAITGLLVGSMGCSTLHSHGRTHADKEGPPAAPSWLFAKHCNPGVRIPARVGGGAAAILVGVPASLVLIPITAPIGEAIDSNLFPLTPMLACYVGGETVLGAIAWPAFGWWRWANEGRGGDGRRPLVPEAGRSR